MRQHLEKPSIATVANRDVNNLRWSAKEQCSVIEVNVLTEDDEISMLPRSQMCVSVAVNRLESKSCSAS
jgi:hypothetical protein